jgi:hypothetical protein
VITYNRTKTTHTSIHTHILINTKGIESAERELHSINSKIEREDVSRMQKRFNSLLSTSTSTTIIVYVGAERYSGECQTKQNPSYNRGLNIKFRAQ